MISLNSSTQWRRPRAVPPLWSSPVPSPPRAAQTSSERSFSQNVLETTMMKKYQNHPKRTSEFSWNPSWRARHYFVQRLRHWWQRPRGFHLPLPWCRHHSMQSLDCSHCQRDLKNLAWSATNLHTPNLHKAPIVFCQGCSVAVFERYAPSVTSKLQLSAKPLLLLKPLVHESQQQTPGEKSRATPISRWCQAKIIMNHVLFNLWDSWSPDIAAHSCQGIRGCQLVVCCCFCLGSLMLYEQNLICCAKKYRVNYWKSADPCLQGGARPEKGFWNHNNNHNYNHNYKHNHNHNHMPKPYRNCVSLFWGVRFVRKIGFMYRPGPDLSPSL